MSDDGESTLVLIVMLGNVFSPRYRAARQRGSASPLQFCAFHVMLGGQRRRFALTETDAVVRSPHSVSIGASTLRWSGHELVAEIDELTPFGRRVRGRVRATVPSVLDHEVRLDSAGVHRWTPLAPALRARVELDEPTLSFEGHAYLDANEGDAPLEDSFSHWSWSRVTAADGRTWIAYDTVERDGTSRPRLFLAGGDGIQEGAPGSLGAVSLPSTWFKLRPTVRLGRLHSSKNLQDAPFYARTQIHGEAFGEHVSGVHEWLDLDRFTNPWVQRMIPYRMRGGFAR